MAHDPEIWRTLLGEFRDGVAAYQGTVVFSLELIELDPKEETEKFLERAKAAGLDMSMREEAQANLLALGWSREDPPYPRDHPWVSVAKQMRTEWPWLGTFCWSDGDEYRLLDIVGRATDRTSIKAFDAFDRLANIAGSHLPLELRGQMPVDRDDPVERWLHLMIYSDPHILLNIRESGNPMHGGSRHPFQDAADVIERCRLDTDQPAFLPMGIPDPEAPPAVNQGRLDTADPPRRGMSREEANIRAQQIAKGDAEFARKPNVRRWAQRIGCSEGTIVNLPFYRLCAEKAGTARKDTKKPAAVNFSEEIEANIGVVDEDPLNRLIAEQEADHEPSPVDCADRNSAGRQIRVFQRKRV